MTSWFWKKKTPDGTEIIRHGETEPQFGVTGEESVGFRRARESVYEEFFGKPLTISHELLPLIPHVDVYTFKRKFTKKDGSEQAFYTLVTGGMSDLEMTLPRRANHAPRRVELIFYCAQPREEYIVSLRWVAHFPHSAKSFLGHGHTMPNGDPPAPFWGSSELDTLLFMPPIVKQDQTLPDKLQLGGQPVCFLWVVPLTTAECNFKLRNGFEAVLDLFQKHRHPYIFDPMRKSYV